MPTSLERLLRRDRIVTLAGLAILCVLAWAYTLGGAGMGMSAWEMTGLVLFPHQQAHGGAMPMEAMAMGGMAPGAASPVLQPPPLIALVVMWWVMMIAMMAPSAGPTILLYAVVHRNAGSRGQTAALAPTHVFTLGYLIVWLGFSIVAAGLQRLLAAGDVLGSASMASNSRWLSAALLLVAGLYQFSPWKQACLSHCRSPAAFLSRHWRPGVAGALRLGALHGSYCLGCCWALMALLFVGGVMNVAWIAVLATLVLCEKLVPQGRRVGQAAGLLLCLWAAATLII